MALSRGPIPPIIWCYLESSMGFGWTQERHRIDRIWFFTNLLIYFCRFFPLKLVFWPNNSAIFSLWTSIFSPIFNSFFNFQTDDLSTINPHRRSVWCQKEYKNFLAEGVSQRGSREPLLNREGRNQGRTIRDESFISRWSSEVTQQKLLLGH